MLRKYTNYFASFSDSSILEYQVDDWTDSEDEDSLPAERRIKLLEQRHADTKQEFEKYRTIVTQRFDLTDIAGAAGEPSQIASSVSKRDDDSHYFESYGANDIHAVMIQDTVRTSTYARYILSTPSVFEEATVLDVGCGTGILSLFAARAGAKRVFAVDASDIAVKAEKIIRRNNLDNIITVIRGKVEDIQLPDGVKVDVIISEWMGYALLYESMLDSVLVARDRFLKPEGVMAPSQSKMMLGLCDASEIIKDRITFWNDVYGQPTFLIWWLLYMNSVSFSFSGFDMTTMAEDLYDEAIIDVVGPQTMLSAPCVVKV
jgi:protein arginine N-methyltransferase 3